MLYLLRGDLMVHTLTLTDSEIAKMRKQYASIISPKKPDHSQFVCKTDGISITVYNSNKVVFQGKDAYQYASQ
jgi:ribonuclease HIII